MAQNYTENTYAPSHIGATDLQNIENNFEVLKSMFSGVSSPGNPVPGMIWFDTNEETAKIRNNANSSWYGIMMGSTLTKIWIYANSAAAGWVVDESITDIILAIKGGSTFVTGGTTAGTWTWPSHTLIESQIPGHIHTAVAGGAHTHGLGWYFIKQDTQKTRYP